MKKLSKEDRIIQTVIEFVVNETVSDAASNFGGWQGGFPGTGDPLKGLKSGGGKDDVGKSPKRRGATVNSLKGGNVKGDIKLSRARTKVIMEPTLKQSENPLGTNNPIVAPGDMPGKKGRTVKQVKESLAELAVRRYTQKNDEETIYAFEKPLAELVAETKRLREASPTNSMGLSSSTHGTGNIDTFDPILSKKILRRRRPKFGGDENAMSSDVEIEVADDKGKARRRKSKNNKTAFRNPGVGVRGVDSGGDVS